MLVPIAIVLAFVAVVMAVQSAASLVFASRDRTRRVNRRLTLLQQGVSPEEVYATLVRKPLGVGGDAKADLYQRVSLFFQQAGLEATPQQFALVLVVVAVLLWGGSLILVTFVNGGAPLLNVVLSLFGASMLSVLGGYVWVSSMRARRLKKIEAQLPLALDIVTRAIRAGHPVISAVQLAAEEMGDPLGSEFGVIVDETTYGLEFKEALINFARRTGSPEAHFFAVSVGIQSETGGNLAEILSNLATVIRNRQSLRMRVKALASEGMASAQILSALPVLLVGWMLLTKPTFYSSKFADPLFWPAVGVIGVVYVLGILAIYRIVNFKY
jgi:tight adherence protein B